MCTVCQLRDEIVSKEMSFYFGLDVFCRVPEFDAVFDVVHCLFLSCWEVKVACHILGTLASDRQSTACPKYLLLISHYLISDVSCRVIDNTVITVLSPPQTHHGLVSWGDLLMNI